MPEVPKKFRIGLIVGPSGSGKTSILRHRFKYKPTDRFPFADRKVCEYFEGVEQLNRLKVIANTVLRLR